ncbi:helix-turn-helix transcriptional regulator [Streptomyces mangrovisoli]|uniref:DNA-binding transcriptional regulator n=1 Tax=Streptomyces mangrovisoli TaxID=1428628 RepID=A0A1J4P024_9ACTN|nr:YafY family protein [Streptomyces mangrovisoli]OIJ67944.1 DNA-binding transcriptional regulator [Streptomyces mangrovisoli]
MKSDRLLSILLLLQTRGRVPARELAGRLEVSVRTVYRDIEALSASGVPVYAERGRHGGIELLAGFRTDVTGLTADESRALFVLGAQCTHAALGLDAAFGSALRKVMAALPAPHRPAAEATSRRILVDATRWRGGPRHSADLAALQDAVFADRRLRLRYRHGGQREPRTYTVDPYGLVAKAGVWYLVADRRGRPQLFRADRVRSARLLDDPVRRRPGVELADAWEVLRREVEERPGGLEVVVRVHRDRLDMFRRLNAAQLAEPAEDEAEDDGDGAGDWVTARLHYGSVREARQLLPFADRVEVLSPPQVRDELAAAAASVTALYRSPAGEPGEMAAKGPALGSALPD